MVHELHQNPVILNKPIEQKWSQTEVKRISETQNEPKRQSDPPIAGLLNELSQNSRHRGAERRHE